MLLYTAEMKRPVEEPLSEKEKVVDHYIDVLGLDVCKDTRIGNPLNRYTPIPSEACQFLPDSGYCPSPLPATHIRVLAECCKSCVGDVACAAPGRSAPRCVRASTPLQSRALDVVTWLACA